MKKLLRSLVMVLLMVPVIVVFTACGAGAKVSAAEMKEYLQDALASIETSMESWTGVHIEMKQNGTFKTEEHSSKENTKLDAKFINLDKTPAEVEGMMTLSASISVTGGKASFKTTAYILEGISYTHDKGFEKFLDEEENKFDEKYTEEFASFFDFTDDAYSMLYGFVTLPTFVDEVEDLVDNGFITGARKKNLKDDGYRVTFEFDIAYIFGQIMGEFEEFEEDIEIDLELINSMFSKIKGKSTFAFDFDKTKSVTRIAISMKINAEMDGMKTKGTSTLSMSKYEGTISAPKGFKASDYTAA